MTTPPLPDVAAGQLGHAEAHNLERHIINQLLSLTGDSDTVAEGLISAIRTDLFTQPGGSAPVMTLEQYDTGSDAGNFAAAFADGAALGAVRYLRLKDNAVYNLGTTTVDYSYLNGDLIIDAGGATVNYDGTDKAFFCHNDVQAAGGGRLMVFDGTWNAANARYFWFMQDCRRYRFWRNSINTPNGSHFYLFNKAVWSERNWFIDIDDRGCQHVFESDRDTFAPTGPAVTFSASTNAVTFPSNHNRVEGDPAQFTQVVGAAPLVDGETVYVHQVLSPTSYTMTLDPTTDDSFGTVLDITSDGTARALDDPQSSFARTKIRNLSLQGGKSGYCKIKLNPGTGMYGSEIGVNVHGNISGGVGIWELNGGLSHSVIGPWDVEAGGSATSFIFRVGMLTGQKPLRRGPFGSHVLAEYDLAPPAPYVAGPPDNGTRTWATTDTDGMRVTHSRHFDGIDQLGRTNAPSTALPNPTWYVSQAGGTYPFTAFGHAIMRAVAGRGIGLMVDGNGGLMIDGNGGAPKLGFFDKFAAPITKPSAANLVDLFTALANLGLITDTSGGAPGGGSSGTAPGQLLALNQYKQSTSQSPSAVTPAPTNTQADLSGAVLTAGGWAGAAANMFDITFTVPSSGKVDIEIQAPLSTSVAAGAIRLSLYDVGAGAAVANSTANSAGGTAVTRGVYRQQFVLTAGQTYTWRPQWAVGVSTQTGTLNAGGSNGTIRIAAYASL